MLNRLQPPSLGSFASIFLVLLVPLLSSAPALACGPDSDCKLGKRVYRIRMPANHDGVSRIGAVFFMHGYRGSPTGTMRNKGLGKAVSDLGLALVAPKSNGQDWKIPGTPSGQPPTELEYFDALVTDVSTRFPIDRTRLLASGFSAGGMMVWNLICDRPALFAAYAPISGTFWEPTPKSCSQYPVHVIHIHGTKDRIVPLAGRPIADSHQGNVHRVLKMYSAFGGFEGQNRTTAGDLSCLRQVNSKDKILEICLHPGGHSFKRSYLVRAWKEFDKLGVFGPAR